MNKLLFALISGLIGVCCASAQTFDRGKSEDLRETFQHICETQNAQAYASLFGDSAVWDGPSGENAIGPTNIGRSIHLMFAYLGPLETVEWQERKLAPNILVVNVYQRITRTPTGGENEVRVAPGSIGPPGGSSLRTTMILKRDHMQWTVVDARVARLQVGNSSHNFSPAS